MGNGSAREKTKGKRGAHEARGARDEDRLPGVEFPHDGFTLHVYLLVIAGHRLSFMQPL